MKKLFLGVLSALFVISLPIFAQEEITEMSEEDKAYVAYLDSIENTFDLQQGLVHLKSCNVTVNVPESYNFIDGKSAERVLTELWGNPPSEKDDFPLGMLLPADQYIAIAPYAFFIYYLADGYVKDNDANKIDYDDMLKDMKQSIVEESKSRAAQGYPTIELLGWASEPYYDKTTKVLHWAKAYQFSNNEGQTLNYDIRVLGRKGILKLQAVAEMKALDAVKQDIPELLEMATFDKGYTYNDYNSSTDHIAEWTIGGLVAGKVLAKAGFLTLILKFWKLILVGLGAIGVFVKRIMGRKKKEVVSPEEETESK